MTKEERGFDYWAGIYREENRCHFEIWSGIDPSTLGWKELEGERRIHARRSGPVDRRDMEFVTEVRRQNTHYRRHLGRISNEQRPYVVSVVRLNDHDNTLMLFEMDGYGLTDDQVNRFLDKFNMEKP